MNVLRAADVEIPGGRRGEADSKHGRCQYNKAVESDAANEGTVPLFATRARLSKTKYPCPLTFPPHPRVTISSYANHRHRHLHRRQSLEELAVREGLHRRGHPRRRRRHPQLLRQDRRSRHPRAEAARPRHGPVPGGDHLAAADPRRLYRRRADPHVRRGGHRDRLLGHHRQGLQPARLQPLGRPLP